MKATVARAAVLTVLASGAVATVIINKVIASSAIYTQTSTTIRRTIVNVVVTVLPIVASEAVATVAAVEVVAWGSVLAILGCLKT